LVIFSSYFHTYEELRGQRGMTMNQERDLRSWGLGADAGVGRGKWPRLFFAVALSMLAVVARAAPVDISGTVNTYVKGDGDVAAGASTIDYTGAFRGAGSGFANGDLLLLIQSQGAEIDSSNTDTYGDGVGTGQSLDTTPTTAHGTDGYAGGLISQTAGTFEYATVQSVAANTITLQSPLSNDFFDAGASNWQIVKVPDYGTDGARLVGTVTGAAWDGDTGGVIAFNATGGTIDFNNNNVEAIAIGFRGGVELDNTAVTDNVSAVAEVTSDAGGKGEGIAGTPRRIYDGVSVIDEGASTLPGGDFGRGAPGNAGGGAGPHNSGGGGGSNAGRGGTGAQGWVGGTPVHYGGYGGQSILSGANMGGGGGSGEANNNTITHGGVGGGVVLIKGNSATGTGVVDVSGSQGLDATGEGDGEGGGGAGGSVIMFFDTAPSLPNVTVMASGGKGGDADPEHGGGGGGGAGYVVSNATIGSIVADPGPQGANSGVGGTESEPGGPGATADGPDAFLTLDTDYGDAPDSYGTISGGGGAYHQFADTDFDGFIGASEELFLGALIDGEGGGNPSVGADSDDTTDTDDEDGISSLNDVDQQASSYTVTADRISVTNSLGESATLHAWIDFDDNGTFDSDEYTSISVASGLDNASPASALFWSSVPGLSSVAQGTTLYARFRLSTDSSLDASSAMGAAQDGEVEDYTLQVADVAPEFVSIERSNPAQAVTNANALVFYVEFSEPVVNVDASDFGTSGAGASGASVTGVAASGDGYDVTVDVDDNGAGDVSLVLSGSNDIEDATGNTLAGTTPANAPESYTLDNTAPDTEIQNVPANTNVAFTATIEFTEPVTGFDVGDISISNAALSGFSAVDGDTYTVTVTPSSQGAFSLDVNAGVAQDAAANANTAATQASGGYDTVPPSVAIQNVPSDTNAAFVATFQFDEAVSGFTVGDIAAGNASVSAFNAVDGDTYTATITPSAEGAFTLDVNAAVASDAAGNANTAATQASGNYDVGAPSVSIQGVPANTNAAFSATFQFSEAVTGFVVGDITTSNASASAFTAVDADTYTATITPAGEGAFTLDVAAGLATDAAGNDNTAATQAGGDYDATAPTLTIQNVPANTNAAFTATFEFSETVTGFVAGDITTGNATVSDFTAVDGDTYTATITPDSDGAFTLDVGAGVAADAAGNDNTAATQAGGDYDATVPTVSIDNVPADTNAAFTVTFQFSESVNDFVVGDVSLTNASLSGFTAVDGDTYTATLTPSAEGAFTLDIAGGVATDDAGNGNTAATQAGGNFDTTLPTVVIQNVPSDTNAAFTATFQFSEVVTGFVVGDISGGNATLSDFAAVDGDTYTATVTPTGEGAFTLDVASSVATDAAGNSNAAATQASGNFDTTAPMVAIQNVPADTNSAFTATFQFSETVSGFVVGDISTSNATLSDFTGVDGDTYTATVTPSSDGAFTLDIAGGVASDAAGNANTAASQAAGSFDGSAPSITIQNVPTDTNAAFTATFQFSESVTGFVVGDISTANASLSDFTAVDGDTYTATVTPTSDGAFTLNIAGGVASDAAGNANTAASQAGGDFDATAPMVAIQNVPADTNVAFTATFQFSETVSGFAAGDISTSNAGISDFASVDGDTYTATVTPSGDGAFSLDVAAGVATDAAGNANTAAPQASGDFDATAPTVAIQNVPANTNAAFTATFQFSESVSGFAGGDITTGNASISDFAAVDADTYTATVTPGSDGAFTLDVAAGVVTDAAGNGNTAALQAVGDFDATAPTVAIQNVPADTNAAFTATFQFSETVSGFTAGDITVSNASVSGFAAVDGDTYTATITPASDGAFSVDVNAAVASDAAGNGNTAAAQQSGEYDTTAPGAAVVSSISDDTGVDNADGLTNDTTLVVTGSAEADSSVEVFLNGGSIGTTSANGSGSWSFDYSGTALAEGDYTLTAQATDGVGNTGPVSADFDISVDTTAPATPSVTAISSDTGAADGITADDTLVISGTADGGVTVEVFEDGSPLGTTTAGPLGNWSFDYTGTGLADGDYDFSAAANDDAGNGSPLSPVFAVTVDTTAPSAPTFNEDGDGFADSTPTLTGTAEPNSTVEVTVGGFPGVTTANGAGDWSITVGIALGDGSHAVSIYSEDVAGNRSTETTGSISIDTVAPPAPVISGISDDSATAGDGITNDDTLVFSGTAEADAAVEVFLGAGSIGTTSADGSGNWSLDYTGTAISDGDYTVTATATDAVGNTGPASGGFDLTVDTAAPVAPTLAQDGQTLNDNTPDLSGTAEADSDVTVTLNGTDSYTTTADGSGNWSLTVSTGLGEGVHTVEVVSTDAAGNSNNVSGGITIDLLISQANSSVSASPSSIAANGSATSTITVSVRDGDDVPITGLTINLGTDRGALGTVSETGGGVYTAVLTAPVYEGVATVSAGSGGDAIGQTLVTLTSADNDNDGLSNEDEDTNGDGDPTNDDLDGDGTPNYLDQDDDGDGTNSADEDTNGDGDLTNDDDDGDGIPNYLDPDDNPADGNDSDGDGVSDDIECAGGVPCPDTDGDGLPDYNDTDDDGDGIPTSVEGSQRDTDDNGTPDYLDNDDDGDGLLTRNEDGDTDLDGNPATNSGPDADGDGIPAYLDPNDGDTSGPGDTDNDGLTDDRECQAGAPCEDTDGDGAPNFNDPDDDNDGVDTANEDPNGDNDPTNDDTDGDGTPDYLDDDDDGDGIDTLNEGSGDADGDNIPDYLDADSDNTAGTTDGSGDSDGDSLSDLAECPSAMPCPDSDSNGTPDYLDPDDDGDGVATLDEDVNEDGDVTNDDTDADSTPDYLDNDDDGDGVSTGSEGTGDSDMDGIPDYLDPSAGDSDGDGLGDGLECSSGVPCEDSDGDGRPDYLDPDDDGDGIDTLDEDLDNSGSPLNDDSDGDGTPDYLDTDDDNDGSSSLSEGTGDSDGDGIPDYLDADSANAAGMMDGSGDSDGDGLSDAFECATGVPCRNTDGDGAPDYLDPDDDGDGIDTANEDPNGNGDVTDDNTDSDGAPNYLDADDDGDGIDTLAEGTGDSDGDNIPDHLDPSSTDSDGDGVGDGRECDSGFPCRDTDGDGTPDYLDTDDDGDGVDTDEENPNQINGPVDDDTDGDGIPDYLDTDDDGDGIDTATEHGLDADADGIPDHRDADTGNLAGMTDGSGDSDGDGRSDTRECPTAPCKDSDGNGTPDYMQFRSAASGSSGEVSTAVSSVGALGGWLIMLLGGALMLRRRAMLLALLCLPWAVQAEPEPVDFYAGAGMARTWLEPGTSGTPFEVADENSDGWQVLGGYRLLDSVSVEGFYADLGEAGLRDRQSGAESEVEYKAYGVLANWYPRQDSWAGPSSLRWYLQAGLTSLDNDSRVDSDREHDAQVAIGGGVEYEFNNRWQVRLSAQSHTRDANVVGLSVLKAWGRTARAEPAPEPVEEPAPQPEPAPEPEPQPVVADTDGDGVPDTVDECPETPAGMTVNEQGCSALDVTLEGVYFASGSAELKDSSRAVLDEVVQALKNFPAARVEIGAHTDAQGAKSLNQALSEQRAESVKAYLVEQGIAADRLEAKGYGESTPVADNATAEGRAKNRRVELKLLP
jgi:outer membrane protein OmpA-like peptidoglycan-associated protein